MDIFDDANSTHVTGRQMMNGIGGPGDFTCNAYLPVFTCPSTAKGGKISTIVPLVSHMDLHGRSPHGRATLIIQNCAHPDFRDELNGYLEMVECGHTPHTLTAAVKLHEQYL